MRNTRLASLALALLSLTFLPAAVNAQAILSGAASKATHKASGAAVRSRNVKVAADTLRRSTSISLALFDDVKVTAKRTKLFSPRRNTIVWSGKLQAPDAGHVNLSVVNGMVSGTVFAFGRTFEILPWADGTAEVRELDPTAFPSDDPDLDAVSLDVASSSVTSAVTAAGDTGSEIDVLVVWTPNARTALGGAAQIQSLVDTAVANANTAYVNSGVPAHLRLVYSGEVSFTETAGSISSDLSSLSSNGDGKLDVVHSLRSQYGADVVTLIGQGYAGGSGACGIGYLMSSVTTSFASSAFNVVDQSCAAGNLSYAHEVGHNEGLHHDPANAGSTPSYPYAYGYQDPSGAFRTVMAYGGAPRIPYFSSPSVFYNGLVTGVSSQDNARALTGTAPTVSAFVAAAGSTVTPAACTYSVTPTSVSFASTGGTVTLTVSTQTGCAWSVENPVTWVAASTLTGSGPGSVSLTAPSYTGTTVRSGSLTVAGAGVSVSQKVAKVTGRRK